MSNATPRRRVERAMTLRNGKPLDQFSAERSCAAPDCSAMLSRYNPNKTCASHGGWREQPTPRRRSRSRSAH
ncbi:MAG TPA: hypothetical protein VM307_03395 [Egibacteraceae bacterium]|nr:hypothetical protein [Egibacteraceae bacterium]